jgi:hypothetical protein
MCGQLFRTTRLLVSTKKFLTDDQESGGLVLDGVAGESPMLR